MNVYACTRLTFNLQKISSKQLQTQYYKLYPLHHRTTHSLSSTHPLTHSPCSQPPTSLRLHNTPTHNHHHPRKFSSSSRDDRDIDSIRMFSSHNNPSAKSGDSDRDSDSDSGICDITSGDSDVCDSDTDSESWRKKLTGRYKEKKWGGYSKLLQELKFDDGIMRVSKVKIDPKQQDEFINYYDTNMHKAYDADGFIDAKLLISNCGTEAISLSSWTNDKALQMNVTHNENYATVMGGLKEFIGDSVPETKTYHIACEINSSSERKDTQDTEDKEETRHV